MMDIRRRKRIPIRIAPADTFDDVRKLKETRAEMFQRWTAETLEG